MGAHQLFMLDVSDGAAAGLLCEVEKRSLIPSASSFAAPGADQDIFDAVEQVISSCGASACRCRLTLPASMFYFKNLSVPFTDRRKIEEIIGYELQDLVSFGDKPFSYDTAVIDTSTSATRLLAAVITESELSGWLELLDGHGLRVEMITVSPLVRLTQVLDSSSGKAEMLIYLDAGREESCLISSAFGAPRAVRVLPGLGSGSREQLVDELLRTVLILKAREGDFGAASLWIGGAAADELGTDLFEGQRVFSTVELVDSAELGLSDSQAMQMLPVYLVPRLWGLASLPRTHNGLLNLARTKAEQPGSLSTLRKFAPVLLLLLAAGGLAVGYQVVDYRKMAGERDRLAAEAERIYTQTIAGGAPPSDPVAELRARIDEIDQSLVASIVARPELSSVALLSDISQRMPAAVRVSIRRFSFDRRKVVLDGVTDAYNDVDVIKKSLESSPFYQAVAIESAGSGAEGAGVRFSISLLL